MFFATKLRVPAARLFRKIFTLAPPPIALIESTIEELPIWALPAATCCNDRALEPELIRSKSRPSSVNKPLLSATTAGQIETLMPVTTAESVERVWAAAGCTIEKSEIGSTRTRSF